MDKLARQQEAKKIAARIREDHQKAEHYLLWYHKEYKAYMAARRNFVARGRHGCAGKDPTGDTAERGIFFDTRYEPFLWLRAVELMEQELTDEKFLFLTLRREAELQKSTGFSRGRHGWVIRVQHKLADAMSKDRPNYWPGERTLRSWWKEMIMRTADIQARLQKK